MVQPAQTPQENSEKKPVRRRSKPVSPPAPDSGWTIKGKNTVGKVEARGKAQVTINQSIREYTPLSQDEEKRRKQKSELKDLENAIRRKFTDWRRLVEAPLPAHGNPFLFLQPFGFSDGPRFLGRGAILQELVDHLENHQTTFLDGCGRTSMIQAGVIPALLEAGHLPLLVSVSGESLEISIKKQLLPNIGEMEFLESMSLTEFVRRVDDQWQTGRLFILVDQFEEFSEQADTFRNRFVAEWKLCVSGGAPDVHWLFSIPGGSTYLLNPFREKAAINPNLITLQPLERAEALQAMSGQAALPQIQIDPIVADTILDELGDRSKSVIEPAQLQLVCYMLAGGRGQPVRHWTMQHYLDQGRVDGILRGYLDRTIGDLEPVQREPAWQVLAALIDPAEKVTNEADLIQKMKRLDIDEHTTRAILDYLEESHLVEYTTTYRLSSDSLRPSIQAWRDRRAALEKAKEEVWRQVRTVGGSALRGLLGGAVGFMLAYWVLPYEERVPVTHELFITWYGYNLALRALVGGMAGFLMVLGIDLILATFRGRRSALRLPAGMLMGAVSFALALGVHIGLHYSGNHFFQALGVASAEGGLWGLAAGAGAIWILLSKQHVWPKFCLVILVCGLVFAFADLFLGGLDVRAPLSTIFISGALLPLFLIGAAWLGRLK